MSHIARIELEINDLPALKNACSRMGLQFREGQTSYKWYYATPKDCTHAIHIPNADYEIGVVKNGNGYILECDFYSTGGLIPIVGENAGLLKQAYAVERVKNEARLKRYRVQEKTTENGIQLVLTM